MRDRLAAEVPAAPRSDFDLNPGLAPARREALAEAAVLVPIVERPAGATLLLTRRAETLSRHAGQIALPGGRRERGETPEAAALRETREEIGLGPPWITPIGRSSPYETATGFRITPVVALVRPGFTLRLDPAEAAEAFEAPLAVLLDTSRYARVRLHAGEGLRRWAFSLTYEDRVIWGATAGVLRALAERLFGPPVWAAERENACSG